MKNTNLEIRPPKLGINQHVATNERTIIFKNITSNIKSVENMLDIGVGDGVLTKKLFDHYHPKNLTVVDPNNLNCQNITKLLPSSIVLNQKWEDVNIKNQRYDFILCSHSAYFFPMDKCCELFRKAANLLSKDGKLLIVLNTDNSPIQKLYDYMKINNVSSYCKILKFNQVINDLCKTNKLVNDQLENAFVTYKNLESFTKFMWGFLSPIDNSPLPKYFWSKFKSEINKYVEKRTKTFSFPTRFVYFSKQ